MMGGIRRFLAIATILLGAGGTPVAAMGEAAEEREAQLAALRARLQALAAQQERDLERRDRLVRQLRDVEREVGRAGARLREAGQRLAAQQAELEQLRREQAVQRGTLAAHQDALARQVRAAYLLGREERLKLLLNQTDPAVATRLLAYHGYFHRARLARIDAIRAALARLAALETRIAADVARLAATRAEHAAALAELERKRGERRRLVADLERALAQRGRELDRLKDEARALAELVQSLTRTLADIPPEFGDRTPFAALRGKLAWPVRGRILHNFGEKRAGGRLIWQGVMIGAEPGADVRAVAAGRVAYADWLPHYGLIMIIEHAGGYLSLYGHNRSLYKEAGEWVETGEVIASVGDSGGQSQAGLYFEIRQGRTPVDPRRWLVAAK